MLVYRPFSLPIRIRGIVGLFALQLAAVGCASPRPHLPPPRQIVLVSFDTLRADHLGPWRTDGESITPNLDAFAKESVVFTNALSTATLTERAHKSLLYGLYHHAHRTSMESYPTRELVTPPVKRVGQSGLQTAALACRGRLNEEIGVLRGFDHVDLRKCLYTNADLDLPGLRTSSRSWISDHAGDEFFLFLHTYQTHAPYRPDEPSLMKAMRRHHRENEAPPPDRVQWRLERHWRAAPRTPESIATLRMLYEAEVTMVDAWFGELLALLRKQGVYERTMIVVFSDHGESLGENGWVGHSQMADEQTFVPLMMRVPGAAPLEVSAPVSLVDVMPTVFELLGLEPPYPFQGNSLVPLLGGGTSWDADRVRIVEQDSRVGLYRGPWKLVLDREQNSTETLTRWTAYDDGVHPIQPSEAQALTRALLREYAAEIEKAKPVADKFLLEPDARRAFSPETLEQLRALGYLD